VDLSELRTWLIGELASANLTLTELDGDASFRRYYRIRLGHETYVAMYSPPDKIPLAPFVAVANAYHEAGLYVPTIHAMNLQHGFLLLEDIGEKSLAVVTEARDSEVNAYYERCIAQLPAVASVRGTALGPLPVFDKAFMMNELERTHTWLLKDYFNCDESMLARAQDWFESICARVDSMTKVGVHRDYHSRNIFFHNEQVVLIDFQDAVLAPWPYDLVSLIEDSYQMLSQPLREHLLHVSYERLEHGCHTFVDFYHAYTLVAIQRLLKVAGIFARLGLRDDKMQFLGWIAPALNLLQRAVADSSSDSAWLPVVEQWQAQAMEKIV